jgi:type IV pilus assembly protein PilW
MHINHSSRRPWRTQLGFTLLETMVALSIGVFMLGALLTIVQVNRSVFASQNQLSQFQDSERMAMTVMTDVIQSTGYFPDPTNNTAATTLTPIAPFASGQAISGLYNATPSGDQISVRYMTAGGDGILNCSGLSNPNPVGGNPVLYVNAFSVVGGQLVCTMNGTPFNLVSGVTNLSVLYGVKTNLAAAGNNVDTYLNASQMSPANWNNVISVLIQLTFKNPLWVAGQGQPQNVTIQRVVGLMNQSGPVL